jgi:NADP-dependent 3-hydroxy acid dehydrogenase YdfG
MTSNPTNRPWAVVTGASTGIDLELAKQFAKNGFDLLIVADEAAIVQAGEKVRQPGIEVRTLEVDLAKSEGVERLYREIQSSGRPLDAIAINAGGGAGGDFVREGDLEAELNVIDLNVRSTVHLAKLVLEDMVEHGRGRVLFTSSIASTMPGTFNAVYNAFKAFVQSFAQTFRNGALTYTVRSHFFTGPLLPPLRIQNTFANECFMDELCAHAKADPVDFRLRHLNNARMIGVVKAAAKAANWQTRMSPLVSRARTGPVSGRGIACVDYEGGNGYAALIAEVDVNLETGIVRPTRFVVALDCGPISNPDGLRNQTEGGILQGMSRALVEEVTWDNRRITSTDWEPTAVCISITRCPPLSASS